MPKGVKNAKAVEIKESFDEKQEKEAPIKTQEEQKPVVTKRILDPLGPGQRYFEAPDGTIVIGEDSQDHIMYRPKNGGKPMYINPMR